MAMASFAELVIPALKAEIYARGLAIGTALGLPTTTWEAGDPTRSDYHFISELLELTEAKVVRHIKAIFLDWCAADPDLYDLLVVHAYEVYGVTAVAATYATCTALLTNAGGGEYPYEPGDLTIRNGDTGKTFTNTTGGTLAAGPATTLELEFTADEAGSESSSAVGEIDEMVTVSLGVTVSNTTAAVGLDDELSTSIVSRCRDKLGALSPNGPRDAYSYVARSTELTGTVGVTRVRVFDDSDTGDVLVYAAGPSGELSVEDLAAAELAIVEWATPLCITPTVSNASNLTVPVTYQLWVYEGDSRTDEVIEAEVEAALLALLAEKPIGGDIISGPTGALYRSHLEATIKAVSTYAFRVAVTLPASETTAMANDDVAVLGTLTATITRVSNP